MKSNDVQHASRGQEAPIESFIVQGQPEQWRILDRKGSRALSDAESRLARTTPLGIPVGQCINGTRATFVFAVFVLKKASLLFFGFLAFLIKVALLPTSRSASLFRFSFRYDRYPRLFHCD